MQLDFNLLLDNIKRRRFDEAIRDHILSPSFQDESIPGAVRYSLESMHEVDPGYAYKVYANTRKIEGPIKRELEKKYGRIDVRYQGPLRTETHIRLYGEVDMLFILGDKVSSKEVFNLGQDIRSLLGTHAYQSVDFSTGAMIQVITEKPACKINIIPCSWINNPKYMEKKNEIYRGTASFNFKLKTKKKTLPFLNMARMDVKNRETQGGYKRVVRLLRSLNTDESVNLSAFELASLIYWMDNDQLTCEASKELSTLPLVKNYITRLLADQERFESLLSPGEKELIFGGRREKKDAVTKLNNALDMLVNELKSHAGEKLNLSINYITDPAVHSETE